ncbi:ribokinase [Defluviimonas sp. WL0050]|uniref:Ribokinase n=1 Tax=Albidovulum litorale TaxID=2984134 RepID=A0ABT2ZS99_9RHOB|nr:ribokinase [Defluviimonas sp. WL0050]MCV2873888.1 ribokinase [Defluviimonas sp. WL0050]
MRDKIVILGVFVADTSYRAERQPRMGETILGNSFVLGPGGKGSNQSVAAAMAGADVRFVTRVGRDAFAEIARQTWAKAGVNADVTEDAESYTGAAYIFIEESTGNNAIIIAPGAAGRISVEDVEARADAISSAAIFLTQLEQPMAAARRGLEIARAGGAVTILNPAPAVVLEADMLRLCDYVTPNESEAEGITGIAVRNIADAERAAGRLLEKGVGAAIITLGQNGVFYRDRERCVHVPAVAAGPVVETTGAGDAFNGAFAAELARGADPVAAVRFGCAGAGISVTRPGTAPSMPSRSEIEAFLASGRFD